MADGTQALPGNRFPHKGRGKPREAAREGEGAGGQQLVPLRKSGGNCGEQDRTSPIPHIKEVCENKDEKWTFEDSGTTTVLEKANSLGSGLLQVNEENSLNEVYQDETRSAKKTTQGIQQRQCQINSTDDEITQSWEIASEDYEWLHSKNTLLLIEKLRMDCKDSVSLLKIQDAVLSYERLIEFKKSHCRLLIGKIRYMENKVSRLQKQLSEIREEKTQLERQTVEREQECCSLRFTLKKEKEKRRNADTLSEKIGEELKRKEKQYSKEVEMKEQLELTIKTVEMELRTVRSNLNQLQEAQNRNIVQEAMKRTKRRLAEVTMELHTEKKLNRSLLSTLTMRPVLKSPCCGNPKNSFMLNRDLVVKENLVIPILRPQPSNNTMDDYLTKIHQELDKCITRELEKQNGSDECASVFYQSSQIQPTQVEDLLLNTSQEYVQFLNNKYMV